MLSMLRFFSSNPATDDETSNPLNIHVAKTTVPFDPSLDGPHLSRQIGVNVQVTNRIINAGRMIRVNKRTDWEAQGFSQSYNVFLNHSTRLSRLVMPF